MAGFVSAASLLAPVLKGVSFLADQGYDQSAARRQQQNAMDQLQHLQDEELRKAQENAALEKQKIFANAETAETKRQAALKRAVARQRARYGGSGIEANSSGSAQALLLGMFDESEDEKRQRETLDNLRFNALDQDIEQRQRMNVLQRTQLAEKQKIERSMSAYNSSKSILGRLFDGF